MSLSIKGLSSAHAISPDAMFPLHSGRILGLPGRIMVSVIGLMVAILSVTGMVIWARKRRARLASVENQRLNLETDLA